jgi:hypothetical protein
MCGFAAARNLVGTRFAAVSCAGGHEVGEHFGPKHLPFVPTQPSTRTRQLGTNSLLSLN